MKVSVILFMLFLKDGWLPKISSQTCTFLIELSYRILLAQNNSVKSILISPSGNSGPSFPNRITHSDYCSHICTAISAQEIFHAGS